MRVNLEDAQEAAQEAVMRHQPCALLCSKETNDV